MEIYLIRHTRPAIAPGICYGQSDLDVAPDFAAEFTLVLDKLKHLETAVVYSSPLQRCFKLAQVVASTLNLGLVEKDARLRELNFGAWEMLVWDDIPKSEIDNWAEDYVYRSPPSGETFMGLYERATEFIKVITDGGGNQPVMVFTHAGVIRALIAAAGSCDLREVFSFPIAYASVTKLIVSKKNIRLVYSNR